jgi:3-oxoacyl-(acyl-carrier-protein) synthase
MSRQRIWITGRGLITPIGSSVDEFAQALEAGRSGVRAQAADPAVGLAPYVSAPVSGDIAEGRGWPASLQSLLDRAAMLGLAAAQAAWAEAGLPPRASVPERAALAWGTGMGGAGTMEVAYGEMLLTERKRVHPYSVVRGMVNASAAHIAMSHALRGPVMAFSNACASSAQAIGEALWLLRSGRADLAIAGGCEALLVGGVIRAWQAMGVLAKPDAEHPEHSCRPFDSRRGGLVLGEGAGALVLETEAHARARGARPIAELAGYGLSCDATHISRPDEAGQVRAMMAAMDDAGLTPHQIGHVNAHGTGTDVGDAVEAGSIARAFGGARPLVSATKALHGHLMGAGGAVELIAALAALERRCVPPTAHLRETDCADRIDLVCHAARPFDGDAVMSNSFAFGGSNAVLVARRA